MGRAPASSGAADRRSLLLATLSADRARRVSPPAARTAIAAADPLRTEADATYTLDPDSGRVHVAIDVKETDLKPNTATYIYYYVSFRLRAPAGGDLDPRVGRQRLPDHDAQAGRLHRGHRPDRQGAVLQAEHAASRSATSSWAASRDPPSPTRVGAAYSTFGVWAWGDAGQSTVEVARPGRVRDPVRGRPDAGHHVRDDRPDPARRRRPTRSTFYSIITAENGDGVRRDAALARRRGRDRRAVLAGGRPAGRTP